MPTSSTATSSLSTRFLASSARRRTLVLVIRNGPLGFGQVRVAGGPFVPRAGHPGGLAHVVTLAVTSASTARYRTFEVATSV